MTVHCDEVVQPPWHCNLTVKAELSDGTPLNASVSMLRLLASYSTVRVFMFVSRNGCLPIIAQPEVRMPQSSGNS